MKQRGYSLLLSLFVIVTVSGVLLAGTTVSTASRKSAQTLELSLAKAALISYAVNYIDHYGAQGAGIGHLPCPDTDAPLSDNSNMGQADPWHRDGPNPPCSKNAVELGWLPRHVSVRNGRYHFHARARQRLRYAVSGRFVNNPIGRTVNPSTMGDIAVANFTDVVAVLMVPPLVSELDNRDQWTRLERMLTTSSSYALIRTSDIQTQALRRTGGWLLEQLNRAESQRCLATENAGCGLIKRAQVTCEFSEKLLLLHWLDVRANNVDCENYSQALASATTLLEDVPINRHWFFRNEWFRYVEFVVHESCNQNESLLCEFALLPLKKNELVLRVAIQPSIPVEL